MTIIVKRWLHWLPLAFIIVACRQVYGCIKSALCALLHCCHDYGNRGGYDRGNRAVMTSAIAAVMTAETGVAVTF